MHVLKSNGTKYSARSNPSAVLLLPPSQTHALFQITRLTHTEALQQHPLLNSDQSIERLIGELGKGMQVSLQLLANPLFSGSNKKAGKLNQQGVADVVVVVTKRGAV